MGWTFKIYLQGKEEIYLFQIYLLCFFDFFYPPEVYFLQTTHQTFFSCDAPIKISGSLSPFTEIIQSKIFVFYQILLFLAFLIFLFTLQEKWNKKNKMTLRHSILILIPLTFSPCHICRANRICEKGEVYTLQR